VHIDSFAFEGPCLVVAEALAAPAYLGRGERQVRLVNELLQSLGDVTPLRVRDVVRDAATAVTGNRGEPCAGNAAGGVPRAYAAQLVLGRGNGFLAVQLGRLPAAAPAKAGRGVKAAEPPAGFVVRFTALTKGGLAVASPCLRDVAQALFNFDASYPVAVDERRRRAAEVLAAAALARLDGEYRQAVGRLLGRDARSASVRAPVTAKAAAGA
jgi:hypothetical protein